nr:hypothetical protein C1892_26225 [Pseudomonas sp. MPBD7-1]
MLPLGGEAAPNELKQCSRQTTSAGLATASQPSGSKLPRHDEPEVTLEVCVLPLCTGHDQSKNPLQSRSIKEPACPT